MSLQSVNPATGEVLETFTPTSPREIDGILANGHAAFLEWRTVPFKVRAERLRAAAQVLRRRRAEFARTMALEMGKPIAQGEAEAEKCAWVCDYYADSAEGFLAVQARETDAAKSYVRFDPLGLVLAVMPWNFPFWQVFRFAAPALMAGNAAVLKHASNVPRCAIQIEEVFRDAGFPPGLFATALIESSAVGALIDDPRIVAVTLTGSDLAGSRVAEQAGKALKKTVLELGGSDAFIVMDDADLDAAANTAADARLVNSGQSCGQARRPTDARRRDTPRRRGVLSADAAHRGRQGYAGLRRGDLRTGGRGDPRQGRGGRGAHRERLSLRSRRRGLDP
jgi:succinate-semialdehyde dehydrogenase/glutarate-semialdehyde dehydrogenase